MDYSEFKCKWIDPVSLCNIADETRNKYWPESKLPVNTEEIVEFSFLDHDRSGGSKRKRAIFGFAQRPGARRTGSEFRS